MFQSPYIILFFVCVNNLPTNVDMHVLSLRTTYTNPLHSHSTLYLHKFFSICFFFIIPVYALGTVHCFIQINDDNNRLYEVNCNRSTFRKHNDNHRCFGYLRFWNWNSQFNYLFNHDNGGLWFGHLFTSFVSFCYFNAMLCYANWIQKKSMNLFINFIRIGPRLNVQCFRAKENWNLSNYCPFVVGWSIYLWNGFVIRILVLVGKKCVLNMFSIYISYGMHVDCRYNINVVKNSIGLTIHHSTLLSFKLKSIWGHIFVLYFVSI